MSADDDIDAFLNDVIESTAIVPTDEDLLEILDESNQLYTQRNSRKFSDAMDSLKDNIIPVIKGIIGPIEKRTGLQSSVLKDEHFQFISKFTGVMCDSAKAVFVDPRKMEKLEELEREKMAYIIAFMRKIEETYPDFGIVDSESDKHLDDTPKKPLSDMQCIANGTMFFMTDVSQHPELNEQIAEYSRTIRGFEQRQSEILINNLTPEGCITS